MSPRPTSDEIGEWGEFTVRSDLTDRFVVLPTRTRRGRITYPIIDAVVYVLYGLTDKEIKIVEGGV